jgi:HSP20 family molecular chaperone IbpA
MGLLMLFSRPSPAVGRVRSLRTITLPVWTPERVGEFARSFGFHVRVDQNDVQASMKNEIIGIVVPKAQKHESRKITIS